MVRTKVTLKRVCTNLKDGTFGVMIMNNRPLCVTLEESWLDNMKNESCIPAGAYVCSKYSGRKYKNVWILNNVPNRSAILIHQGNTERNTSGCILVGASFAPFDGVMGVANSTATLDMLRKTLPDEFILDIQDYT